jgi:hypothetical protein
VTSAPYFVIRRQNHKALISPKRERLGIKKHPNQAWSCLGTKFGFINIFHRVKSLKTCSLFIGAKTTQNTITQYIEKFKKMFLSRLGKKISLHMHRTADV